MDRIELPAHKFCEECARTPAGVAGHDALRQSHEGSEPRIASGAALFECGECEARWARTYCGEGFFAWTCESPGFARAERS